jgi:hypothetical protein
MLTIQATNKGAKLTKTFENPNLQTNELTT